MPPTPDRTVGSRQDQVSKFVIGAYLLASALSIWVWAFDHDALGRITSLVFSTLNIPLSPSLVSVAVLAMMSGALVRRKRLALYAVVALQLLGLVWSSLAAFRLATGRSGGILHSDARILHLHGVPALALELVDVGITVALLVVLWWVRPAFPARTPRASWWRSAAALVVGYLLTLSTVALLVRGHTHQIHGGHPSTAVMRAAMRSSVGLRTPGDGRLISTLGWIPVVPELMLTATLLLAVWLFLRSVHPDGAWSGATEVRVRELLARYGGEDSLGYFATRRDKSFVFSPDGRAVIAYRVIGTVCLASGDPVGDPASWPAAISAWRTICRDYGWVPAATSVSERGAAELRRDGMGVLVLGDEAVLHPDRFTLDDTSMTPVRQAVGRARREGLTLRVRYHGELSEDEMAEIARLADAWRLGGAERGFSMALERLGDPADARCTLVTAHDPDGAPVGLLSFVPWGRTGLSLDLMRRSPQAPGGVTEFMVAGLMEAAGDRGIRRVSLNFAVLRSTFADAEKLGASTLQRAGSSLLRLLDRFTQIESLYRNNEKYQPEWVPRYACVEAPFDVPRALVALGRAEGFLPTLRHASQADKHLTGPELEEVRALAERPEERPAPPRRGDQTRHRLRHLEELRATGHDPFAVGVDGGVRLSLWRRSASTPPVQVRARVRRIRDFGGVVFLDLVDDGVTAQALAERGVLGRESLRALAGLVDTGDMLVLDVVPGFSRTGTPALMVRSWRLVAKCLHPLPFPRRDGTDAFTDVGLRLARRSEDLLVHPRQLELLRCRTTALATVRATLVAEGYREVETPMLGTVHGGATARPFRTYSNAYRCDLVLRIAPELALKRLLVGGMGPVFEMGRNFRNEGADATHNPEFTSLEVYQPFGDYTSMRELTERLVKAAAEAVHGRAALPLVMKSDLAARSADPDAPEPELVDVSGPWPVVPVCTAVSRAVGRAVDQHTPMETLLQIAATHQVAVAEHMGPGAVLEELYGELVEPRTLMPTFYTDFPAETSPLTAPHRDEPGLVERWDLVVAGMELGTAYSELTDPLEQRRRLTEQSYKAAAGDLEAMEVDEDFLHSLELGMPPTGGLGIGVDRLVMALTGTSIRDVLTFPFTRPDRDGRR